MAEVEVTESPICICGHRKLDHHSLAITACEKCNCEEFVASAVALHTPKGETGSWADELCVCAHAREHHQWRGVPVCERCRCGHFRSSDTAKEEVRTTSATGGEKGVKPERFDLIPVEALQEVARVYGFGAQKYAAHNWRKGYEWSKSYAAMMRHANQFWAGEDMDEETGCLHLASVIFHAMALMVFIDEQPQYDDRFKLELTQIQKENLKAFTDEMLGHNRIAVKNHLDDGSPLVDRHSDIPPTL